MVVGGVTTRSKRRGPPAKGKKAKVSRRNYVASQIGSSDDDFVSPPLVGLGTMQEGPELNAPDGVKGGEDESHFPKVKTRSPAVVLVDALKDLSCQQKDDIRDMGFGALLEFNVGDSPPCLVHWLLSNFDGEARAFDLGGGRLLPLEESDVELVLGFPRGGIEMVKRDKLHISNLLQHWRGKFEKKRHYVTPSEIATHMVKHVDGGILFRRHFCMLVLNTLVGCMRNGYANQMYFQCFDDVRRIRDLNWCKLLVDSLVETQAAWKSGRHKCFVGPAEFVARELSKIRTGGFGMGVIEPPIVDGGDVDGGGDTPTGVDDGCSDCSTPTRACEYGPKVICSD
nr:uncharacterized protein LOC109193148 isoform X1 [Ipomoea batatas]